METTNRPGLPELPEGFNDYLDYLDQLDQPVSFDVPEGPAFVRPELLLHPPIPPALYGRNPRTAYGREWWNKVRRKAYRENNYHCWACGTHRLDARVPILDAHECYKYDYKRLEATLTEVVALCRNCHYFIHWRRITSARHRRRVLERGLDILLDAGLPLPEEQLQWLRLSLSGWELRRKPASFTIIPKPPIKAFYSLGWKLIL